MSKIYIISVTTWDNDLLYTFQQVETKSYTQAKNYVNLMSKNIELLLKKGSIKDYRMSIECKELRHEFN